MCEFNPTYFPLGWYRVYDSLGDGCEIVFPIRLQIKIKWSGKIYEKQNDGTLVATPPTFMEVIIVTLVKRRCR